MRHPVKSLEERRAYWDAREKYIPWEDPRLGLLQRYWKTLFKSVRHPRKFFVEMPPSGGYRMPASYCIINIVSGCGVLLLTAIVLIPVEFSHATALSFGIEWLLSLFLLIAALHTCVFIHRARGFERTFRIFAYSTQAFAPAWVIGVLQIVGLTIGGCSDPGVRIAFVIILIPFQILFIVWHGSLIVTGLEKLHGLTVRQSVASYIGMFALFSAYFAAARIIIRLD